MLSEQESRELMREGMLTIASIFFYGDFVAETVNERRLEKILTDLGMWPATEDQIVERMQEFYR